MVRMVLSWDRSLVQGFARWRWCLTVAFVAVIWIAGCDASRSTSGPKSSEPGPASKSESALTIQYPLDGTVFPPDIVAPTFRWEDARPGSLGWLVEVELAEAGDGIGKRSEYEVRATSWTATDAQWEAIKKCSVAEPAKITVTAVGSAGDRMLPAAETRIHTSADEVGAPIFYREVNLPFGEAVRDPGKHIRWRFGHVSSKEQPPVVLDKLPVCGNCHSFTADGRTIGMDVDFASDKGSYVISPVDEQMSFNRDNIITWSDFRRTDGKRTFGLLSSISPDGRYVLSTVKDLSVFLAINDNLAFSQLFFPIQGILCYYDRETETFHNLPGADDPRYVQSNPTWSPDGKYVVFARSEAYDAPQTRVHELGLSVPEEVPDFVSGKKKFLFDLYRIPFNDGKGGQAEPVQGASANGKSNYFPKYSPDGKWIVFCQAASFMLLQPDSELYVIPADGGTARRLECNTDRMNSWHSWSPNGKWLVFSSKANSIYTQLMLTHFDEQGHTTPPVELSHFTSPDMAANIPEFVNTSAKAIQHIAYDQKLFADAAHVTKGDEWAEKGEWELAASEFEKAIQANPEQVYARTALAHIYVRQQKLEAAESMMREALRLEPDNKYASTTLGQVLFMSGKSDEAEQMYRNAIGIDSTFTPPYLFLANILFGKGQVRQARQLLNEAIRIDPDNPGLRCRLAHSLADTGQLIEAIDLFRSGLEKDPTFVPALIGLSQTLVAASASEPDWGREAVEIATKACERTSYQNPEALIVLSDAYAAVGEPSHAIVAAKKALRLAEGMSAAELADAAQSRLQALQSK